METFPQPQHDNEKQPIRKKLATTLIAGSALLSVATSEAQQPAQQSQTYEPGIALRDISSLEKDSAAIIGNLEKIEASAKKAASRTADEPGKAYAVISESNATGTAHFASNAIESAITEDIQLEIVNASDRNYKVLARDRNALQTLQKERQIMERYGVDGAAGHVFDTYVPVQKYIVVGVVRDPAADSALVGTIRIVDMQTKTATLYTVPYQVQKDDLDNGYEKLSQLMQDKIQELMI